ncbi:hypothetical protein [Bacillus toyonensis]|uniref:hypothetical protein n=1 Tax=Bacillus toyonensis TaxID=155322 RepID=UPI002E1F6FF8|nr:hypothetical protein [Bacillus toyonensis]
MQTENFSDFRYINECIASNNLNPADTLFILYKENYISFYYIEQSELKLVDFFSLIVAIPDELLNKELDKNEVQRFASKCYDLHRKNVIRTQQITKVNIDKVVHIIQNTRLKEVCNELNTSLLFNSKNSVLDSKTYNF